MRRFQEHVRDTGRLASPSDECACCDEPASHFVRWAGSYMRGEDDTFKVCARHQSMASSASGRFFAHMRSKDRFLTAKKREPQP